MQRGFTVVEMAVAVGILALLVAAGGAFALGMRPFAVRTAATQFDAQLQAARSLAAATGNGATIIVTANGTGFRSVVYGGRPNASGSQTTLTPTNDATIDSEASIGVTSLGGAPFAIFLSSSGAASVEPNYPSDASRAPAFMTLPREPQTCPQPENAYTLTFSLNGATQSIALPCRLAVSGTPLPVVTNTPGPSPSATPTPAPPPAPIPTPTPAATPSP